MRVNVCCIDSNCTVMLQAACRQSGEIFTMGYKLQEKTLSPTS